VTSSIGLGEDDSLGAGFAGEGAGAGFGVLILGDAADGDFEVVVQLCFGFGVVGPVCVREAAMDLVVFFVFGCEVVVKVFLVVDLD